jgi:hypothetical protein
MKYCFDWGDGIFNWTGFVSSGELVSINHTWTNKGNFNIRVKLQDEHGLESDWSDPLPIKIPRTNIRPIFGWLFNLHRIIFS